MKYLYFADMMGDIEEERDMIKEILSNNDINIEIKTTNVPPESIDDFDVLFFDWGGMSLGNDMMGYFCNQFISEARDNPSKLYIMVSSFTKEAMEDALSYLDNDNKERPANIFLKIEDAIPLLKAWEK